MDAYNILGVQSTDSIEFIKKAYRKLANKHHPDKGGSDVEFKKIQQAYDNIKSGKASTSTTTHTQNSRSYDFRNATDIYNYYQSKSASTTKSLRVQATISIFDAINGGMQIIKIQMIPNQNPQYINIEIPPGIVDGMTIKFPKILIHTIDVYVTFRIINDKIWSIKGIDLTKNEIFDFWDLIIGCSRNIETITKEKIKVTIPPMTSPDTILKIAKKGAKTRQNYLLVGDMYVKIHTKLPDTIPDELLTIIKEIKNIQ